MKICFYLGKIIFSFYGSTDRLENFCTSNLWSVKFFKKFSNLFRIQISNDKEKPKYRGNQKIKLRNMHSSETKRAKDLIIHKIFFPKIKFEKGENVRIMNITIEKCI